MQQRIYKETTSETLFLILEKIMDCRLLEHTRLVGGTSLSLQLGHRKSVDIDLFTAQDYGTLNFQSIDLWLSENFSYVDSTYFNHAVPGKSYFIGDSEADSIKLDIMYTDPYIRDPIIYNNIRLASSEDIAAMKLEVISDRGRKKDFWDIAELLDHYTLKDLISFYSEMFPWAEGNDLIPKLTDFGRADDMEDPICLRGKAWELIKLDITEVVNDYIRFLEQS